MDTLKQFSEKKENYDLYQALQAKQQARKDVEQARKSDAQSQQEAQRLKDLLKKHGIDSNEA